MANVIYPMIIFLFVLGAGTTYFNELGLYEYKLPETGVAGNTSQATEFNSAMMDTSKDSNLNAIEQLYLMGKCIVMGLVAIFTLGPMLQSLGIPGGMVLFLISPMAIVLVFWLVEMWLGRSME